MSAESPRPTKPVACPSCGLIQTGSGLACARCGKPLNSPGVVYRREDDGSWAIIRDIDLSTLAPKLSPARTRLTSRAGGALLLIVAAVGALFDFWTWKTRGASARQQAAAVAEYLSHPMGTIIPSFRLTFRTSEGGRLEIFGETNLPDGTALEVQVFDGESLVSLDSPVMIANRQFKTRPLLARGAPFLAAGYRVRIRARFEKRWQPSSVLLVVGEHGERLAGGDIRRNEAPVGAMLEYEESFALRL